jgi:hypothetical protein
MHVKHIEVTWLKLGRHTNVAKKLLNQFQKPIGHIDDAVSSATGLHQLGFCLHEWQAVKMQEKLHGLLTLTIRLRMFRPRLRRQDSSKRSTRWTK